MGQTLKDSDKRDAGTEELKTKVGGYHRTKAISFCCDCVRDDDVLTTPPPTTDILTEMMILLALLFWISFFVLGSQYTNQFHR
jgi:hypothetical protein